jgi:hypothetical protein
MPVPQYHLIWHQNGDSFQYIWMQSSDFVESGYVATFTPRFVTSVNQVREKIEINALGMLACKERPCMEGEGRDFLSAIDLCNSLARLIANGKKKKNQNGIIKES